MASNGAFYEFLLKESFPSKEGCSLLQCSSYTIPFSSSSNDRATQNKQVSTIVGVINANLNDPLKRYDGIWLLSILLPQCSWDIFTENALSWAQQILRAIQTSDDDQLTRLAAKVMGELLKTTEQFPDLSRQFSSSVVNQVASTLTDAKFSSKTACLPGIFACLRSLMKSFNGPCGPSKASIEKFLLGLLDRNFALSHFDLLANCFALLPQLGGGGVQGVAYKTNWTTYTSQLIGSAQESLNELFEGRFELESYPSRAEKLALPKIVASDPLQRYLSLKQRFCNILHCLAKFLSTPFLAAKVIPYEEISALIVRTLSMQPTVCVGKGLEGDYLAALLPDLHISALRLMPALAAALKSCAASETHLWWQLWARVLQYTQTISRQMGQERPYGKLRAVVYEVVVWCMKTRSVVCVPNRWTQEMITQALYDTSVDKEVVKLQATTPTSGPSPNKKKRRADITHVASLRQKSDETANSLVCEAALNFLSVVLSTSSNMITSLQYQAIQKQIMVTLESAKKSPGRFSIPFGVVACRKALYSVLRNLLLFSNPRVPTPLNQLVDLLDHGMRDADVEVSFLCEEIMAIARTRIQPSRPSWNFPTEGSESVVSQELVNGIRNNDAAEEDDIFPTIIPESQTSTLTEEVVKEISAPVMEVSESVEEPVVLELADDSQEPSHQRDEATMQLRLSPDSSKEEENVAKDQGYSDDEVMFEEEIVVLEGPTTAEIATETQNEVVIVTQKQTVEAVTSTKEGAIQGEEEVVSDEVEMMLASFVDENSSPVPPE